MLIDRATQQDIDIRHGSYERVMADVMCDALIVDTPYSERTHTTQRHGAGRDGSVRKQIAYRGWSPEMVQGFVDFWAPRTRGWLVSITDAELYPEWRDAMRSNELHVFQPLPVLMPGMNVRLTGDGPSSWAVWRSRRPTSIACTLGHAARGVLRECIRWRRYEHPQPQ